MRSIPIQGMLDRGNKKLRTTASRFKRFSPQARSLPRLIWNRILWGTDPKRRKVQALLKRLEPLPQAPEAMQWLRREVYQRCLLEIKDHELRLEVPLILAHSSLPAGPEQIFLIAIYPLLIHRRLVAVPRPSPEGRLDVDIGYRGHADEYYFWEFEIDGRARDRADRVPTPRRRSRGDKLYWSYPIPAAGLVDLKNPDPDETILLIRSYFLNILEDLKRRGYQLNTAQPPPHEVLIYNQRKFANSRIFSPFEPKRRSFVTHRTATR